MTDKLFGLILKVGIGVVIFVIGCFIIGNAVTTVGAEEIVVKQNFLDGQLQVWSSPGVHWQNFGRITRYKRSAQYWFSAKEDEGKKTDDSINVQFNDGAKGTISGSLRYDLPIDAAHMINLHSKYGSMEAINHELVKQAVNKSVYMTAQLISSRESYAEKRADLINFISDQIVHGVYRTERHTMKITDLISGQEKTVDMVQPKSGAGPNGIEREEISPIETFGIAAYNITINEVGYSALVEEQIKQQQQATMAVQQAMVDARKAEQRAITTAKEGEADAAKSRWAQEVIKAKEVTEAEQKKAVAELSLQTAKLQAEQTMTEAKAESDAKKLQVQANNNFQERLNAYVEVAKAQASALGSQRQTPDVVLGGSGGSSGGTQQLMEILAGKAAKDLSVNMKP